MKTINLTEKQRKTYLDLLDSITKAESRVVEQRDKLGALLIGLGLEGEKANIKLTESGLEIE